MSLDEIITTLQQLKNSDIPRQLAAEELPMELEPMTAFTDALLAAWVAFLAARLFATARGSLSVKLWGWAFVAAVVSSLAGVAYHGWRVLWTPDLVRICWKVVPVATGVAALCLGSAAAIAWLSPKARRIAIAILGIEFVACVIAAVMNNSFLVAAIDYLPVLLALLIGSVMNWTRPESRFITLGVIVSFIGAGVQSTDSLHLAGLDHNDIFHVIQAAAMYLLYRGGKAFGEPEAESRIVPAVAPVPA